MPTSESPVVTNLKMQCRKRDGSTVPFDSGKIRAALTKCFAHLAGDAPEGYEKHTFTIARIANHVVGILAGQNDLTPDVETVQRLVIQQLWAEGLFLHAEHYQNYREERRKARETKPIPPSVQVRFDEMREHFPTDLQAYQFMSKFSRWREDDGRRETWKECVHERVTPWLFSIPGVTLAEAEKQELRDSMYAMETSPAMRVVQMAGPALDRCNVGAYNCLTEDTPFITDRGVRVFSDFVDGDRVRVLTHKGLWQDATVRHYGHKFVNEITFVRGRATCVVKATPDHRWVLFDGTVTTNLREGDRVHRPPTPFAEWNYDDAPPDEKLFWACGFVYGDGTLVKKGGEYKSSMVRLCGDKAKYLDRFTELGFSHSFPPSNSGDPVVYTGTYLKKLPDPAGDGIARTRAFVAGWLAADGGKNPNWCPGSGNRYRSIQTTGEESVGFVRSVFPSVGVYITSEEDVTDRSTSFGPRSGVTVRFHIVQDFGNAVNNSTLNVKSISSCGNERVPVWCLEVEEDKSFVLPSGLVTGNCAYHPLQDQFAFAELLYILMQGTGAGFSCENDYVSNLPRIKKQNGKKETLVCEDHTEGWCDTFHRHLQLLWDGWDTHVDVTKVRPKGARLKTKGGRSSGPGPYLELISFSRQLLKARQGRFLEDIDAHDLACKIGTIVQVGGVRRAAEISLSDLNSRAMREAKSGNWYDGHRHRTMANNSAVYDFPDGVPVEVFMEEWLSLVKSKSGERGIFNRQAALKHKPKRRLPWRFGGNPCLEIILRAFQFCNLSIVIARAHDTRESLARKVRVAAYWGKIQSMATKFGYIRDDWRKNCVEERLLGVDITGHADCPLLRPGAPGRAELLRYLAGIVSEVDRALSARWGVNLSAANTTVKPGGDSAVMFNCGSGVSPWFADYTLRNVREPKGTPIAKFLRDSGVPCADAPERPAELAVFSFPRKAPEGATKRNDLTAIQQLENWFEWKTCWAEHSVSATIYVEEHEWPEVGAWVYKHIDDITGLSFLPKDNGIYTYAPNEELTREQYEAAVAKFPTLNWAKLTHYEESDETTVRQTMACVGGACDG